MRSNLTQVRAGASADLLLVRQREGGGPKSRTASRHRVAPARRRGEARSADEPAVGLLHRVDDDVAAIFGDVALDQRAGVEVDVQRSASRSASSSADALVGAGAGVGACAGRARDGGTMRPAATSWRSRLSPVVAPAGTMSATGCPRTVARTSSPRPTACSVSLSERLSSRRPISRMCPQYQRGGHTSGGLTSAPRCRPRPAPAWEPLSRWLSRGRSTTLPHAGARPWMLRLACRYRTCSQFFNTSLASA